MAEKQCATIMITAMAIAFTVLDCEARPNGASAFEKANEGHNPVKMMETQMVLAGDMAPEPDYEAVIGQEFQGAVSKGTGAALLRFIARHPDHPLADRARSLLANRKASDDPSLSRTDPDASIYAAFEEARRRRTVAAFAAFVRRYPNHPLAAEARRRMAELQQVE